MEAQKIVNLLNSFDYENSKFATKNGISLIVNKQLFTYLLMKLSF